MKDSISSLGFTLLAALTLTLMIHWSPGSALASLDVEELLRIGQVEGGRQVPPMGGPVVRYVTDPRTGKKYLVEFSRWGRARISGSDLNEIEEQAGAAKE